MSEIWKAIPGFEGYYEVSDQGRVRSLDRVVEGPWGPKRLAGKMMALSSDKDGYLVVGLFRNGQGVTRKVHTLVLEAFVDPRPSGHETGHRDGNPSHNRLTNIRYVTRSKNQFEAIDHGRRKFTPDQVREIRQRRAAGEEAALIAERFGVSRSHIYAIDYRQKYASVPDHA